jgi:purine-binding chemotaxis protein CheW
MNKETKEMLKARAKEMAEEPELKKSFSPIVQLIAFSLGAETYGLESAYIREVYPLKDFTPLPGVPAFILGIINVRGQIMPVVDLKKLFHLPEQGITELNKVIILHDDQMEFGILADVVHGTHVVEEDEIIPAPHTLNGIGEENLKGITRKSLIVLNAKKLLTDKRMMVNDEIS